MKRASERGLTFVTVLIVLGIAAGIYWFVVFGTVYWDNREVKALLAQAANIAYQNKDDRLVRINLERALDNEFGMDVVDAQGKPARRSRLEFEPDDLKLERTQSPPMMRIDLRYARTITLPGFGSQRRLYFDDHVEQDLSVVKW